MLRKDQGSPDIQDEVLPQAGLLDILDVVGTQAGQADVRNRSIVVAVLALARGKDTTHKGCVGVTCGRSADVEAWPHLVSASPTTVFSEAGDIRYCHGVKLKEKYCWSVYWTRSPKRRMSHFSGGEGRNGLAYSSWSYCLRSHAYSEAAALAPRALADSWTC